MAAMFVLLLLPALLVLFLIVLPVVGVPFLLDLLLPASRDSLAERRKYMWKNGIVCGGILILLVLLLNPNGCGCFP